MFVKGASTIRISEEPDKNEHRLFDRDEGIGDVGFIGGPVAVTSVDRAPPTSWYTSFDGAGRCEYGSRRMRG